MRNKLVDVSFLYKYLKINKLVTHDEFYSLPYSAAFQLVTAHHSQHNDQPAPIKTDWRMHYISNLIIKQAKQRGSNNGKQRS